MSDTLKWLNQNAAFSEWGLLLVAIVTAAIAIWQIFAARRLQEHQARPYVVVGIRRVAHGIVELYVRNLGSTVAHSVTMKMTPEPTSVSDSKFFKLFDMIPTLVPGDEWSTLWETHAWKRFGQPDVPSRFDVDLKYLGQSGKRKTRSYSDPFVIDWDAYRSATYVERKNIEDVARELKKIRKALGTDRPGQHTLVEAGHTLAERTRTETADSPFESASAGSRRTLRFPTLIALALRKLRSN